MEKESSVKEVHGRHNDGHVQGEILSIAEKKLSMKNLCYMAAGKGVV